MSIKPSDVLRFLGALAASVLLLGLLAVRVTSCSPLRAAPRPAATVAAAAPAPPAPRLDVDCADAHWTAAARANAASLRTLAWSPFGRPETGWETYAPLIARETGSACAPDSPGFAAALAAWQTARRLPADGVLTEAVFAQLKALVQVRRPFVQLSAKGVCPSPPPDAALAPARPEEAYGGKAILLRPGALAAYRAMAAAARAEDRQLRADPRNLTIFSGFRSPESDAARCALEANCQGIVRARCSPHRTGLAIDLYMGQAPGFGPDSSADPNRLYMSRTPAYRWMLANAQRFGFVNYPFEPWHWEWTGEAP